MEETQTSNEDFLVDFAISGEAVLKLEDKSFEIVDKPTYSEFTDKQTNEKKKKLKCQVRLSNGSVMVWYPNKTSQKAIVVNVGTNLNDWKGYTGTFVIREQMIGDSLKPVIYVE